MTYDVKYAFNHDDFNNWTLSRMEFNNPLLYINFQTTTDFMYLKLIFDYKHKIL